MESRSSPPPHPSPPQSPPPTTVSLQPSSSTQFKKGNKQKLKKLKEAIIDSGIGKTWPSPIESPSVTEFGWPRFPAQQNLQPRLPTAEELTIIGANRAQQHAMKAVSEYLKYSIDDEDEDEDVMKVEKGEKHLNFITKMFEENGGLREYYEKSSESGGEFSCLVCCGVGKKVWSKRFKDCVALFQHLITIRNMNTRKAHRARSRFAHLVLYKGNSHLLPNNFIPNLVAPSMPTHPSQHSHLRNMHLHVSS